ncbi:ABC transporter permease [Pseudomonas kurunegalensis]|uniref:ABC transporter permease n=1 Tax=Pseudomonas kurunegalensis TaxID=485880 RepID=UPI0035569E11
MRQYPNRFPDPKGTSGPEGDLTMNISQPASGSRRGLFNMKAWLLRDDRIQANGVKLAIVLLAIWGSLGVENFASVGNFQAIMYSVAAIGVAAVGMAFITLSGNLFMLSMAATAALSTVVFAHTLHLGLLPAVVLVAVMGSVIGALQGVAVGIGKVNPIITTIAVASIIMGVGSYVSRGLTVVGEGDATWLGVGKLFSVIPNQLVILVVFAILADYLVQRTRFGRELRLIGLNSTTAYLSGIRVGRTLIISFIVAGFAAALAGSLFASQSAQGNFKLAAGLDFDAIAAVLVGGVSIRGGSGRVIDAVYGAIFLAIITNLLLIQGLSFEIQLMVKGVVVVLAVILGAVILRMRKFK